MRCDGCKKQIYETYVFLDDLKFHYKCYEKLKRKGSEYFKKLLKKKGSGEYKEEK